MSKINICPACQAAKSGIKSRIAFKHTCGLYSDNAGSITYPQHKQINLLLQQTGLMPYKNDLVLGCTNGRTESRKDLTWDEADGLIKYLRSLDATAAQCEQMRRKIISMAHNLKWENKEGSANMHHINEWCLKHSYLKKKLNQYTYSELPRLVSQFQSMYKSYINKSQTI